MTLLAACVAPVLTGTAGSVLYGPERERSEVIRIGLLSSYLGAAEYAGGYRRALPSRLEAAVPSEAHLGPAHINATTVVRDSLSIGEGHTSDYIPV